MKNIILLSLLVLVGSHALFGQLTNKNAQINIKSGTSLNVHDFVNKPGAVIDNAGTIITRGGFDSTGDFTSIVGSMLEFRNNSDVHFYSLSGAVQTLTINAAAGTQVFIDKETTILKDLVFASNDTYLNIETNDLNIAINGRIIGADVDNFITSHFDTVIILISVQLTPIF